MADESGLGQKAVEELKGLLEEFPGYTQKIYTAIEAYQAYDMPDKYELLLALLSKQEEAIRALLAKERLPYPTHELVLHKAKMLHTPHLTNSGHIAAVAKAQKLSDEVAEALVQDMRQTLHEFKDGTATADILPARVVPAINRYLYCFPAQDPDSNFAAPSISSTLQR